MKPKGNKERAEGEAMDKELIERLWNEAVRETNALGPRLSLESKFAHLVAEECARVCESEAAQWDNKFDSELCTGAKFAANAIRAKFVTTNAAGA